jgi:hypothetical protein
MSKDAMVWVNSCRPHKDRKQTTTQGPKPSILSLGYEYDLVLILYWFYICAFIPLLIYKECHT